MTRDRMAPQERRRHLLDVGVVIFAEQAYSDVSMSAVAASAGVSRALLYHYFPTKRDYFAAIWKRAHDGLLDSARFDGTGPVIDQVRHAVDAHLSFYEANLPLVFIANRSEISSDPKVRDPVMHDLNIIRHRILDAMGLEGRRRDLASAGLAGWIAFIREVSIEWLQDQKISRGEVLDLCMNVLTQAVGDVDLTRPPL